MIRFLLYLIALFLVFTLATWLYNGGLDTIQKKGLKHVVTSIWEGSEADSTNTAKE